MQGIWKATKINDKGKEDLFYACNIKVAKRAYTFLGKSSYRQLTCSCLLIVIWDQMKYLHVSVFK